MIDIYTFGKITFNETDNPATPGAAEAAIERVKAAIDKAENRFRNASYEGGMQQAANSVIADVRAALASAA